MHDAIFAHQSHLSLKLLAAEADKLGLDPSEAIVTIKEQRFVKRIQGDFEPAKKPGSTAPQPSSSEGEILSL